ncbi:MAG: tetratricopeptide repeat protein, partial [bacterium]
MTAQNINQLIDDKQFGAALKFIDTGEHVTAGINTEQASKLLRYMANRGMLERAVSLAESFLEYHTEDAEIHFLLGNTALKLGDVDKAMLHLERANNITPNKPLILANLSVGYNSMDQHGEAIRVLEQAANLHPQYAFAHQKMGSVLCKAGQVKRGMRAFERAMMLSPNPHYMFARLLYWKNYLAESRPETIYADAKSWGEQFTHTFEKGVGVHLNDLAHQKRLNVGFVSPDFCAHPVSFFVEPLFKHLDRDKFKIFAYSDVVQPDKVTESLQKQVDVYHPTAGKDVQTVARMILDDQIDILFDLAGHTGSGRLDLFH